MLIGTISAALAVAPAIAERGQALPYLALAGVLAAVIIAGLASSLFALAVATRVTVVEAIKSE